MCMLRRGKTVLRRTGESHERGRSKLSGDGLGSGASPAEADWREAGLRGLRQGEGTAQATDGAADRWAPWGETPRVSDLGQPPPSSMNRQPGITGEVRAGRFGKLTITGKSSCGHVDPKASRRPGQ